MWTTNDVKNQLLMRIEDRTAIVGVVGLGYVGLPFAVEQAKAGFRVIGIEQNKERAEKINRGENFIPDVAASELQDLVRTGRLKAVESFSSAPDLDVIVICVPTNLTRNYTPDLQHIVSATQGAATILRRSQLICLESTTYPGTTEELMLPMLEKTGLKVELDFFLAHSPERVDPGNARFNTKNTPKLIGGAGPQSQEVAQAFYSRSIDKIVEVSNAKTAELAKVFENTFRAVNIALVNELTILCDKIDINVWEVLKAAYTKPFGIMPFYPGPGVGGHCIPIDPHYLEWKAKEVHFETRFIALAGEINRNMPAFVREKTINALNRVGKCLSASKIAVLGVAYKSGSGDYRESPSMDVIRLIKKSGAHLVYHDPYVPMVRERDFQMEGQPLDERLLREQDLTLILTDHPGIDYPWVVEHSALVLDTRNATRAVTQNRERIVLL